MEQITDESVIDNNKINNFYLKLKEKYMDKKNTIFFDEFIENLHYTNTINPLYFIKCYDNNFITQLNNIKKYSSKFEDMYNIALESISEN
jgi:hypothetical protein